MIFSFQFPWLAVLIILPFIVRLLPIAAKLQPAASVKVSSSHVARMQKAMLKSQQPAMSNFKISVWLLFLVWIFLTLSIMRPQLVDRFTTVNNIGYDLLVAVDLSRSMLALDFSTESKRVSRVDVVKEVVGKFTKGRKGDRVGLVLFGDNAYLRSPLTTDTEAVSMMLSQAVVGVAGDATAIGDALGVAVKVLRDRPEGSRVIILLTDGDNTAGVVPPLEAAKLAKNYAIRIYTIAVGKSGRVPFPDRRGGVFTTTLKVNEDLLKDIANITGGLYFRADSKKSLEDIYDHIDTLEKSEIQVHEHVTITPLYHYPLSLAVFIFILLALKPFLKRGANV